MTVLITHAKNAFWLCCSGIWSLKNMQASCLQQYKCNFNNNFSSVLCNRFFVQWHLKGTLFLLEEELNILLSVAVIIVLTAGCWKEAAPCVYLPISAPFSQKLGSSHGWWEVPKLGVRAPIPAAASPCVSQVHGWQHTLAVFLTPGDQMMPLLLSGASSPHQV